MTRPTPTTPAAVGFALHVPRKGLAMDRNGQLLIFATHRDAVSRLRDGWEIMPIDLKRSEE